MRINGYTYEADVHCPEDAYERFGERLFDEVSPVTDAEGNEVHPIFSTDSDCYFDHCGDCGEALFDHDESDHELARWAEDGTEVSAATARKIASEWHGGQASALYAFASTGTILPGLVIELLDEIEHQYSDELDALRMYALAHESE